MTVYLPFYTPTYIPGFPVAPLGLAIELNVGGWTDITGRSVHQSAIAASVTLGRQNETTQATPSACALRCDNTDGNLDPDNPLGTWYGLLGLNTPVRVSVPGDTALRIEDDTQASAQAASFAAVTGDIDIRLEMALTSSMPCSLACGWLNWALVLNGDGTIGLLIGAGILYSSTQPIGLGHTAIRVTRASASGVITFYTSSTISGTWTQLGSAVASPAGALGSGAGLQAGYDAAVTTVLGPGYGGPAGRFYDLQVRNGIGGTLVAAAGFSAQAAGTSGWTDAAGLAWNIGSGAIDDRSYRYHGECSSLPEEWDPTGHDIWTPVTAGGVLRRIQAGNSPAPSVMRRTVGQQPSVVAYWPAEDAAGSTVIASGLPGGAPMSFAGAPGFQGTAGSSSADTVFACSAQAAQVQSSIWAGTVPPYTSIGNDAVTFLLYIPAGAVPDGTTPVTVACGGHALAVLYNTASGGELSITEDGSVISVSPLTGINGVPMLAQLNSVSGAVNLFILPAGATAAQFTASTSGPSGPFTRVLVNQSGAACGATEIGHLWVTPDAPDLATLAGPLTAWAGETAAARFARLCAENNIAARVYGPPALSALMGPQPIDTLSNLLQYSEDADRGQIFEPRTCLGLGYRTLHSLCAQSPAVTADYSAGEVSPPLKPVRDDLMVRNDQIISRSGGSSVQVQVTTGPLSVQPPPDGAGDYENSLTVYCQSDAQLPHIAGWMAHVGTAPGKRYPVIFIDLASTDAGMQALIPAVRDANIGDYLQVINTPQPLLPPGTIDQLIWGVKEDIGDFAWRMQFNTVPGSPYNVAIAGTGASDSFHADTDGSELHTSVSATATTLSIATTGPSGVLWTTAAGDFPFNIIMAGEVIEVTNITGASSPQSFTVTRSVNGVSKAQTAGAAVNVWPAPVLALA